MTDHFELLGLPRRFALDPQALEQAYRLRSRAVHPDYHAQATQAERQASMELSAALNTAYTVLRDPFRRADYLLQLLGGPSAAEHKQMPPDFLAEMLECREQLEQARGQPQALARLEADFHRRSQQLIEQLGQLFAELEQLAPDDPRQAEIRRRIRMVLNAGQYVRGLLRDLNAGGA